MAGFNLRRDCLHNGLLDDFTKVLRGSLVVRETAQPTVLTVRAGGRVLLLEALVACLGYRKLDCG